jgi:hypothetical protein
LKYFWPPLFSNTHDRVNCCNACQCYARNNLRVKLPLYFSLPLMAFDK